MQKSHYHKELTIAATQRKNGAQNSKKDVMKIQSWLCLYSMTNHGSGTASGIDGGFGSATEQAASRLEKNFKTLMPLTFSYDTVGITGLQKGLLTRFTEVRNNCL